MRPDLRVKEPKVRMSWEIIVEMRSVFHWGREGEDIVRGGVV